ncbi:hypothetical protein APS_0847 [Acetobacter pasteurianus subsp. pasteurianus LMG 1262 = NBRC 106471]|nr:hypothetical protein APS_0847 [Acetobacter pasteurianus subsp. pasteurianus LMG 1262 = NBRC 106471]
MFYENAGGFLCLLQYFLGLQCPAVVLIILKRFFLCRKIGM